MKLRSRSWRAWWAIEVLVVAILYYGAARLGLELTFAETNASPVWPASGIALAAVVLLGGRVWPGIAAGALLANVPAFLASQAGDHATLLMVSAGISTGNTLEAVVGGFLFRRLLGPGSPFDRRAGVFKFTVVALVACLVSPMVGPTAIAVAGLAPFTAYGTMWLTWWLGNITGMLLVTPLLLTWAERSQNGWTWRKGMEAGLLFSSLLVAARIGFGGWLLGYQLMFLPVPWLVWAAVRFGPREAAAAAAFTSGIAVWDTVHGVGPFVSDTVNASLVLLQAFVSIVTVTILTMAAVVTERRLAEARLRSAFGDLETRVRERTRELTQVNDVLQAEIIERKRAEAAVRAGEAKLRGLNEELVRRIAEREQAEEQVTRLNQTLRDQLEQLKRSQAQLVQAEKLATLGNLLAGVAHELNNPLTVIVGRTKLLQTHAEAGVRERAAKIARAAERCARIVRNLLARARHHPPERQEVQLNAVVEDMLELLAYHLRLDTVEVVRDLANDLPPLWADVHQLHQVVINLVTNALQAMRQVSGPRRLSIRTRHDPLHGLARLEVEDTGPGISPEIRPRVFEPFFTTKPPGEGTGLGLALCQGIVEEHGGRISVDTRLGQGTVFLIDLPISTLAAIAAAGPTTERPLIRGKAILVVDDDPDVADMLAEILAADGHQVTSVGSGTQALDRLREGTYDLIFSDIRRPGLDGLGLYRELERQRPELLSRFIVLSGDILSPHLREFLRVTGLPEITKPFSPADARRVIQDVLSRQEMSPWLEV